MSKVFFSEINISLSCFNITSSASSHNIYSFVAFEKEKFLAFENWFIQKYQCRVAGTKINYQANESVSSVIKEPDTIDNTMTLAASIARDEKIEMP